MKDYLLAIMKDHKGDPSSSRWIAFLGFFALCALIYFGLKSDPKQHKLILELATVLQWIIIGCVGWGQGTSAVSSYSANMAPVPAPSSSTTTTTTTTPTNQPQTTIVSPTAPSTPSPPSQPTATTSTTTTTSNPKDEKL